jgi:transposase
MQVTTIGLDSPSISFNSTASTHREGLSCAGVSAGRNSCPFSKLSRRACLEACGTAHHWARQLVALGHTVRMMPPAYVKPHVKRQKNDMADAEAIREAVTRPSMRFVLLKSEAQQSVLLLRRSRDLLVRQRTMLVNAVRAHLAGFGIVAAQGAAGLGSLPRLIQSGERDALPQLARDTLNVLSQHLLDLQQRIAQFERKIIEWHRCDATSQRLATIPGIGPITASALAATITHPELFSSGRQLAAWLGLVPRQSSSGGKEPLGRIHKARGSVHSTATHHGRLGRAALCSPTQRSALGLGPWAARAPTPEGWKVVAVALANKTARRRGRCSPEVKCIGHRPSRGRDADVRC